MAHRLWPVEIARGERMDVRNVGLTRPAPAPALRAGRCAICRKGLKGGATAVSTGGRLVRVSSTRNAGGQRVGRARNNGVPVSRVTRSGVRPGRLSHRNRQGAVSVMKSRFCMKNYRLRCRSGRLDHCAPIFAVEGNGCQRSSISTRHRPAVSTNPTTCVGMVGHALPSGGAGKGRRARMPTF